MILCIYFLGLVSNIFNLPITRWHIIYASKLCTKSVYAKKKKKKAIKASQIERKCRQKKVKLVCIKTSVFTCFQNSATYISTIHSNSILNPLLSNLPFSFAPTSHLFLSSLYLHSTTELNSVLFLPNVNEPKYAYPYHRQGSWQNT